MSFLYLVLKPWDWMKKARQGVKIENGKCPGNEHGGISTLQERGRYHQWSLKMNIQKGRRWMRWGASSNFRLYCNVIEFQDFSPILYFNKLIRQSHIVNISSGFYICLAFSLLIILPCILNQLSRVIFLLLQNQPWGAYMSWDIMQALKIFPRTPSY